jgi:hypothetical protein
MWRNCAAMAEILTACGTLIVNADLNDPSKNGGLLG